MTKKDRQESGPRDTPTTLDQHFNRDTLIPYKNIFHPSVTAGANHLA